MAALTNFNEIYIELSASPEPQAGTFIGSETLTFFGQSSRIAKSTTDKGKKAPPFNWKRHILA